MNIKSIAGNLLPVEIKKAERRASDTSADRDPSGQGEADHQPKPKMTQEQLEQALEQIKALSGVKDNHLHVRLESKGSIHVVFIEDSAGKVIRRIPESELWSLLQQKDRKTGQLFDKTG